MDSHSSMPITGVRQVAGNHYAACDVTCPECGWKLQHWDLFRKFNHLVAAATKYLMRFEHKGGFEDLFKARSYTDKIIETRATDLRAQGKLPADLRVFTEETLKCEHGVWKDRQCLHCMLSFVNKDRDEAIAQNTNFLSAEHRQELTDHAADLDEQSKLLKARIEAEEFARNGHKGGLTPWQQRHPEDPHPALSKTWLAQQPGQSDITKSSNS